jgi:hypothetical protein
MAKTRTARPLTAKQAMIAANRYILFHYPTMFTGTLPHRLTLKKLNVWTVPIVLTHADHGNIGEVGVVAINAATGEVLGATSRTDVVAAGKKLREAKPNDLEAAFLSARAV